MTTDSKKSRPLHPLMAVSNRIKSALSKEPLIELGRTAARLNKSVRATQTLSCETAVPFSGDFRQKVASDTLFALGSGPSINQMNDVHFSSIRSHDSLGFNLWLYHDFVPRFYLYQADQPLSKYSQALKSLIQLRARSLASSEILLRNSMYWKDIAGTEEILASLFPGKQVWMLRDLMIYSKPKVWRREMYWEEMFEFLKNLGFYEWATIQRIVPSIGGSLGLIIGLAVQLGYRNLVLCGFDMRNREHFYDQPGYNLAASIEPPRFDIQLRTTFLAKGSLERSVSLIRFVQRNTPMKIWIADPKSAFAAFLPLWKW